MRVHAHAPERAHLPNVHSPNEKIGSITENGRVMITERYLKHNPLVSYILFKTEVLRQNNTPLYWNAFGYGND